MDEKYRDLLVTEQLRLRIEFNRFRTLIQQYETGLAQFRAELPEVCYDLGIVEQQLGDKHGVA